MNTWPALDTTRSSDTLPVLCSRTPVYRLSRSLDLEALLDSRRQSAVTYRPTGATLTDSMPPGFRQVRRQIVLSDRPETFPVAREGLRTWQAHRGIGATVSPGDPPAEGATVIVSLRRGPLAVIAPCRVVAVLDNEVQYGFAYGTLPGHPEQGEEAFVVERRDDGVVFEIIAFSRPADWVTKLGGPVSRLIQQRATRGYLEALRRWVSESA